MVASIMPAALCWFLLTLATTWCHALQYPLLQQPHLPMRRQFQYPHRRPHLPWRSDSSFADSPAYLDFGPSQYQEEEVDQPAGTVLDYEDLSGYEQPLSQHRLYDVLLKVRTYI